MVALVRLGPVRWWWHGAGEAPGVRASGRRWGRRRRRHLKAPGGRWLERPPGGCYASFEEGPGEAVCRRGQPRGRRRGLRGGDEGGGGGRGGALGQRRPGAPREGWVGKRDTVWGEGVGFCRAGLDVGVLCAAYHAPVGPKITIRSVLVSNSECHTSTSDDKFFICWSWNIYRKSVVLIVWLRR